jgi:hypothetical protein
MTRPLRVNYFLDKCPSVWYLASLVLLLLQEVDSLIFAIRVKIDDSKWRTVD